MYEHNPTGLTIFKIWWMKWEKATNWAHRKSKCDWNSTGTDSTVLNFKNKNELSEVTTDKAIRLEYKYLLLNVVKNRLRFVLRMLFVVQRTSEVMM